MKTKILMWLAACFCALTYAFAYWCESAYHTGLMRCNEPITLSRLTTILPAFSWADISKVEIILLDILVLAGLILVPILATGVHRTSWRPTTLRIMIGYSIILILGGGGIGILMLFTPWTIDGEFFSEGCARLIAGGVWTLVTIGLTLVIYQVSQPKGSETLLVNN